MKKIIKYLVFGFATLGFGSVVIFVSYICYISGVFDKFILENVNPIKKICLTAGGKFEVSYQENASISVCDIQLSELSETLYGYYLDSNPYSTLETIDDTINKFKQHCKQSAKQGIEEVEIDGYGRKYVMTTSFEYSEDKRGKGFCRMRSAFWIKK